MTYIAYYRVSTDRQGRSGLGLDAQREAVQCFAGRDQILAEYTEVESGRKTDRPQLVAAMAHAKRSGSVLLIAKLDRLARNVHFISGLLESKVAFRCADMPEADVTFLQMMAVFAELEARKISERTTAALQALKARGRKLGCPTPERGAAASAIVKATRARAYAQRIAPILADVKASGAQSLREIAAGLQARHVATPAGSTRWHPQQVSALLDRLEAA
jgi:DNA invertase Pin-like site-specific DNA recombinase